MNTNILNLNSHLNSKALLSLVTCALLSVGVCAAKTEDFSGAATPSDAGFYTVDIGLGETAVTSIINTGTNANAIDGNSVFVQQASFEAATFSFDTISLDTIGDSLTLSFDVRFVDTLGLKSGLRFGLYNQNGTLVTGNASTESSDDFGYRAAVSYGPTEEQVNSNVAKETGTNSTIMSGSDSSNLGNRSGTSTRYTDNDVHRVFFNISRTAAGVDILYTTYSGPTFDTITASVSASDTSGANAYTSFNEFALAASVGSNGAPFEYVIDNITVIPEASSSVLLFSVVALGGVILFRRKL